MSEMEYRKLSDCAEFRNERTKKINVKTYITTENMIKDKGGISVSDTLPEMKTASAYKPSDILLSNIRPYFKKIWYSNRFGSCSNDILVIKSHDEMNPKFLFYVLSDNNFFNYATVTSKGTKMPRGTQSAIMKYLVPKIDILKQEKIADILSTYDDLIENNNKRIKLLEQMAENLYKEWFVRFRFPGYEDVEFENGIPKGWEEVRAGEFINLKSGYAFKSDWWTDEGVPVIKIKDIQDGKIDLTTLDYVSEENAQKAKKFYVGKGDILIALTGATIGKVGIVTRDNILVNQRVGKFFIEKPSIKNIGYIYNLFKQNWIQELIVMYSGSNAAQPNISPFDIEKFRVIYNKVYVDKFNVTVYPIYDSIIKLYEKNDVLIKQRDLLLPRLMSGKLEV